MNLHALSVDFLVKGLREIHNLDLDAAVSAVHQFRRHGDDRRDIDDDALAPRDKSGRRGKRQARECHDIELNHGMSDFSPQCAPKRTPKKIYVFMSSRPNSWD